ncbi:MAG: hypothetical protein TU36_003585 [Vulcanisaeta sp. AZ3]|jgi:hypothetical protein|nr:MAG: hypothetical protein TU36_01760 [Vulcanisaeta sp. AZ3]
MENVDKRVYEIHSKVMKEFMNNKCYDIDENLVIECINNTLSDIGLSVKEVMLFDLDGNITQTVNNARYVKIIATSNEINGKQIFTFALIRYRDKYRVLYLQSAIKND